MSNLKKFYFITLAFILLLTGCFGGNTTETSVEKEISKVEQTKQDGVSNASSGTVLELKQKHGTNQDKAIMPMYNVDYDKEFSFSFKADLGDLNFYDVISVHTDSKVLEESQLYTLISTDSFMAGPTTLTIKPSTAILASNSTNRGFDGWGNAPVYYIKVSYDLDTDTPTKLDEPIVIPFTVKSDVKVPNLNYEIDLEGKLKLVWDEFEGATSYNVYQIARWTDETNSELRSAEIGYLGLFPQLVGTTTETEFNDWLSDGTSGLTFVDEDLILYQNHGLQGEYFVTALMDDKESNFSSPVNTAPLSKKLPRNLISNIGLTRHKNINTLPRTTQVEMLDGTVSEMNIIYDVDGATGDNDNLKVKFSVQGTALREYIWLENVSKDDLIALKERNPENTTSARIEPKNEIDHVPAPEVPTVISL